MKNPNNSKNRPTADQVNPKKDSDQAKQKAVKNDRERKEKEQVSAYSFNRGYYSRNGGDNGYRGL